MIGEEWRKEEGSRTGKKMDFICAIMAFHRRMITGVELMVFGWEDNRMFHVF